MRHERLFARLYKPLLAVAALIVVFWALNKMAYVVTTLLLAFFITIVVAPTLGWLQRRGLSRRLSLVALMVLMIVVFGVLALTIVFSVADLITSLPTYQNSFQSTINAAVGALAAQGLDFSHAAAEPALQASHLIGSFVSLLKSLLAGMANALLILLVLELFLLDADRVPVIVSKRFPGNPALNTFGMYCREVRSYFLNTALLNLIVAGVSTVLLFFLRVPNPLLWGVAIFVLRFVPVIGIWIALIPLTFTALVANGPQTALLVFASILLVNGVTSNTLYYRLLGAGLNLSPAAMFISLLFWTFVLGVWGALLALPLTLMVKTMILDDDAKMVSDIISYTRAEIGQG
jgi:AI-2 transport protein TqsA